MKNEIIYRDYTISFTCGFYWVDKYPCDSLRQAKETIDYWEDELIYLYD